MIYRINQGQDLDVELDLMLNTGAPCIVGTTVTPAVQQIWVQFWTKAPDGSRQTVGAIQTLDAGEVSLDGLIPSRITLNLRATETANYPVNKYLFAEVKVHFLPDPDYADGQRIVCKNIQVGTVEGSLLSNIY